MGTDNNFAHWMAESFGIQNARIVSELSGGNSNRTQLVESDRGRYVLRSAPAATISPKAHLGVQREARFMQALAGPIQVSWLPTGITR